MKDNQINYLVEHVFESLEEVKDVPLFQAISFSKQSPSSNVSVNFKNHYEIADAKRERKIDLIEFHKSNPSASPSPAILPTCFTYTYNFTRGALKLKYDTKFDGQPSPQAQSAAEAAKPVDFRKSAQRNYRNRILQIKKEIKKENEETH